MSADEIKSMITRILIVACSGIATKYGVDGNTLAAVAGAIGTLAAFGYGIWANRGMKKVPQSATALALPTPPPPKGTTVDLAPLTGTAKVV